LAVVRSNFCFQQDEAQAEQMREKRHEQREKAEEEIEKSIKLSNTSYEEIYEPKTKGRVVCFDLETTGFSADDEYVALPNINTDNTE
jgi:uncharacterized protein YprB with RNaseH-like and TPR domain